MVEFSKYEFNNKLLSGVTLFRVSLDVNFDKFIVGLRYLRIFSMLTKFIDD